MSVTETPEDAPAHQALQEHETRNIGGLFSVTMPKGTKIGGYLGVTTPSGEQKLVLVCDHGNFVYRGDTEFKYIRVTRDLTDPSDRPNT